MTEQQRQETYAQMLVRLSRSNFRSRFHLKAQDKQYIRDKGWNTIADHAADFVSKRLAPAAPKNDGKQTPMRGHPVFMHLSGEAGRDMCIRQIREDLHSLVRRFSELMLPRPAILILRILFSHPSLPGRPGATL